MGNATPRFRSWTKAYGGDPDSTILRDLHRRLMKVEIAQARDQIRAARDEKRIDDAERHILYLKGAIDKIELGHLTNIVE